MECVGTGTEGARSVPGLNEAQEAVEGRRTGKSASAQAMATEQHEEEKDGPDEEDI